jgi:hypothetical protein
MMCDFRGEDSFQFRPDRPSRCPNGFRHTRRPRGGPGQSRMDHRARDRTAGRTGRRRKRRRKCAGGHPMAPRYAPPSSRIRRPIAIAGSRNCRAAHRCRRKASQSPPIALVDSGRSRTVRQVHPTCRPSPQELACPRISPRQGKEEGERREKGDTV